MQILPGFDGIINFAAESHVDRSILGPESFVQTNVVGTQRLLDAARKHEVKRFLQISTDEVYGSLGRDGSFLRRNTSWLQTALILRAKLLQTSSAALPFTTYRPRRRRHPL